ncbi:MAG: hypothetical protein CUN52_08420 [Phototrophicales bacterium]|nr:MAG: hypothetical protein CUN52_08420 [Phototrophicales bacterium]
MGLHEELVMIFDTGEGVMVAVGVGTRVCVGVKDGVKVGVDVGVGVEVHSVAVSVKSCQYKAVICALMVTSKSGVGVGVQTVAVAVSIALRVFWAIC